MTDQRGPVILATGLATEDAHIRRTALRRRIDDSAAAPQEAARGRVEQATHDLRLREDVYY